ncbi:MAG TPA: hypothetical protein VHV51_14970 [Polyangiaceae bacterium]|nr:hypothetical protein [Polyangiaceae bacterium]
MRFRIVRYLCAANLLLASIGVLASCVSGVAEDNGNHPLEGQLPGGSGNGNGGSSGSLIGNAGTGSNPIGASGSTSVAGTSSQGGSFNSGGFASGGSSTGGSSIGGTLGSAGTSAQAGNSAQAGTSSSQAGSANSGGTSSAGGSAGKAGSTSTGGSAGKGGSTSTGGSAGQSGSTGQAGNTGQAGATGGGNPLPPIQGGTTGFATRYWDCCKPACAWPGSQAMESCDSNNSSQGRGNSSESACSGGNSFMCYNYEPWVDPTNANVAYGFAAASGSNYVCGRCFEVQFSGTGNSGGTNGLGQKTMYLQVINNGGVQSNQFDILIPGGGVGALNACTQEWGQGADLGSQYGGLFAECMNNVQCTQQKCNTVFAGKPDLLAGCSWFLGWFTAADNPNINFKQVSCPSQLTQKSGMSGG